MSSYFHSMPCTMQRPPHVEENPVWQQVEALEQKSEIAGKEDAFNQIAARHVQSMLRKLIVEHQSSICSLQSEIQSLNDKLWNAQNKLKQEPTLAPAEGEEQPAPVEDMIVSTRQAPTAADDTLIAVPPQPSAGSFLINSVASDVKDAEDMKQVRRTRLRSASKRFDPIVLSKMSSSEVRGNACVRALVSSNSFELMTGLLILINAILIAMQVQYEGFDIGYSILPHKYPRPGEKVWPGAESVFVVSDICFNTAFCVELFLRVLAYRLDSFRMPWMWFDSIVVSLGLYDTLIGSAGFVDPTMIRLVRLVRISRMLKIFKAMASFDSLFLLLKSIYASIGALCWSFLLLLGIQIATGLFISQLLHGFIEDSNNAMKSRTLAFTYFGTFARSMLTMFEITLGNWVPTCRDLFEEVDPSYFLFYIVYRCIFCFSIMKVIAAVFIAETNRVLANDMELSVMQAARESVGFNQRARAILTNMDEDHDGTITWKEMEKFVADPDMVTFLTPLGVNRHDLEKLFWLVEEGGSVNIENFLTRVGQLKGQAKTVDLLNLFKFIHRMELQLQKALRFDYDAEQVGLANTL